MRTFRAIAIGIAAFVVGLGDGNVEYSFGFLNLRADFGQVTDLQRGAVLLDDFHQVDPVKVQVVVNHFESFLGKIEGLLDQVTVGVLHTFFFMSAFATVVSADSSWRLCALLDRPIDAGCQN